MTADYLSTLASMIGQYSGGNNNSGVTNIYLDGKLIQRQISKVSSNNNFASNK